MQEEANKKQRRPSRFEVVPARDVLNPLNTLSPHDFPYPVQVTHIWIKADFTCRKPKVRGTALIAKSSINHFKTQIVN